jgi:hypothetical protein
MGNALPKLLFGLGTTSMPEVSVRCHPAPPRHHATRLSKYSGVHVRSRADETWKAIENDPPICLLSICCDLTIFCIQNADYVLCPTAVVSRMIFLLNGMGGRLRFKVRGLGLVAESILRDHRADALMYR